MRSNIFQVSATNSTREDHGRVGATNRTLMMVFVSLFAFLLVMAPAGAAKTHVFLETFGSAAHPSFGRAYGLTVDQSSGDLLVIDNVNLTVSRYKPNGEPDPFTALGTNVIDAKQGIGGKPCAEEPSSCDQTPQDGFEFDGGSLGFPGEAQVAIDESGTATNGDIYVTQGFSATGNLVDIFASDGKYLGHLTAAGGVGFGTTGSFPFSPCGAAVDANGSLFLGGGYDNKIYKFVSQGAPHNPLVNTDIAETFNLGEEVCSLAAGAGSTAGSLFASAEIGFKHTFNVLKLSGSGGSLQGVVESGNDNNNEPGTVPATQLVTVDPATGHLYTVSHMLFENGGTAIVNEYDASGSSPILLSSFTFGGVEGIAVSASSGRVYVDRGNEPTPTVSVYSPLVTVPDVTTGGTAITGDTSVSVEGVVNPDGIALEECRFEYGKTVPGDGEPYEHSEPCAETLAEIGTSTKTVHIDLNGLSAETLYHYRLVAKNTNATIEAADLTFQTPAKPVVSAWAVGVGAVEATLKATIDPENAESTYRIEWGPELPYAHSTTTNVVASGRDAETHAVSLFLEGLKPGTLYHYRIVASNNIGVTEGGDHFFRTFALLGEGETACPNQGLRTGPSAGLVDCRAYELVTPLDKNNGDILTRINLTGYSTNLDQSSSAGSGFTYSSYRAFAKPESAPYTDQFLAFRDPVLGWSSQEIDPSRGPQFRFEPENEYQGFSPELKDSWLLQEGEPTLDACAPAGFTGLYRRESVNGAFHAVSCAQPTSVGSGVYRPELQGFSADGSHTVFRIDNKLAPSASSSVVEGRPVYQVYESTGTGVVHVVSVLPNGEAGGSDSSAGSFFGEDIANLDRFNSVLHAVSSDGTRVFWSTGRGGTGPIYLRLNADQPQSKIVEGKCSQPTKACTVKVSETATTEGARFQMGNPEGTKALFTVSHGPLAGNLYEFDSSSQPAVSHLIATGVMDSILGSSEDLSRVYFVSEEASAGEQAEGAIPGKPNIYLAKEGTTSFIATLSSGAGDSDVGNGYGTPIDSSPIYRDARVSADGASVVFMSNSLALSERAAGYDNTDASSGQRDTEVYLYDSTANGGGGVLHCVSCNPSGARPSGREIVATEEADGVWGAARVPVFESQVYQPRYVSDDGKRVFFDSYDALVLGDTNGKEDVYEWEEVGSGSCTSESFSYVTGSEGCLSLITSGRSPADSEFLDASVTGSDVFFTTVESLLPQDAGLIDVYDARVDGGFPPPAGPPAGCEGEACQGPPVAPFDTTPASFAFSGPGNPVAVLVTAKAKTKPKLKPCKKGTMRKKGKCVKAKRVAKKGSVSKKREGRSPRRAVARNGRAGR